MHLTLVPAYGRDYTSKKKVLADLLDGKDFEAVGFAGNGYVGLGELLQVGAPFNVRYQKLTKVAVFTVKETPEGIRTLK